MSLVVRDGALYDKDGVLQKLEFGNIEQIKAIREHERKIHELENDGVELDPEFEVEVTASVEFRCTCGKYVYFYTDAEYEDDIRGFNDQKKKCKCGINYKLEAKDYILCKKVNE